jgi:hypothetical protein
MLEEGVEGSQCRGSTAGGEVRSRLAGEGSSREADLGTSHPYASTNLCTEIFAPKGPALIPLESLLNIANFVAGDNDYGTLLNFAVASKLVQE